MLQAVRYAFPNTATNIQIISKDFVGLTSAYSTVLQSVQNGLTLAGGGYIPFKQYQPFVINSSTPGFSDLLRTGGSIKFYISADDPIFYDLVRHLRLATTRHMLLSTNAS